MNDVVYTLETWLAKEDSDTYQPAGRAMAKAFRALGITFDTTGAKSNVRIRTGGIADEDDYTCRVQPGQADSLARELWKDNRVTEVYVEGVAFPKPVEKTVESVQKEFEAFKKKVVEVAFRAKREEDWCRPGFERALKDLGLEPPAMKVKVVLELDLSAHDTALTGDATVGQIKSLLQWDAEWDDIKVLSTEPIKD